jgi:hypothetical protein
MMDRTRAVYTMGFNNTMWKEKLLFGQRPLWSRRMCHMHDPYELVDTPRPPGPTYVARYIRPKKGPNSSVPSRR